MAILKVSNIRAYEELDRFLGDNQERTIGYKTVAWRATLPSNRRAIAIRQWNTDIYTITPNNVATLDIGGWFTITTKDRLNQLLPYPMRIQSEKERWVVLLRSTQWEEDGKYRNDEDKLVPFANGIQINVATQEIVANPGASDLAKQEVENDVLRKKIKEYVAGLTNDKIKELVKSATEEGLNGDCLFCHMSFVDDTDHLISHLDEKYYMVSLMLNACRFIGYQYPEVIIQVSPDGIRRAVSRYLRKKLLKGVTI